MYLLPEAGEADVRIVAIDPGSDTMGVAIIDINIDTNKPTLVFGTTLVAHHEAAYYPDILEVLEGRDVRIGILYKEVVALLNAAKPTLVVAESPFHRNRRANAYEALVECFKMLRLATWSHSKLLTVKRLDPLTVKRYVGVTEFNNKKATENAVIGLYQGSTLDEINLLGFDEHTYDAIAVGHAAYRIYYLKENIKPVKRKKVKRGK